MYRGSTRVWPPTPPLRYARYPQQFAKQEAVKAEAELRERGSPSAESQTGEAVSTNEKRAFARSVKLRELTSDQSRERYSAPVSQPSSSRRQGKARKRCRRRARRRGGAKNVQTERITPPARRLSGDLAPAQSRSPNPNPSSCRAGEANGLYGVRGRGPD